MHGLGGSRLMMAFLCWHLRRSGMRVINFGYNSWRLTIEDAADRLAIEIKRLLDEDPDNPTPIHFVAHSLGGIVVRQALAKLEWKVRGRIVFLGSPHYGTPIADRLSRWLNFIPVIRQLRMHSESPIHQVPLPADWECGTVAAKFDWIVPPQYARLKGERDHIQVPTFHAMIFHRSVVRRVLEFLRDGLFQK